jgi:putative DNA primase/helicase
VVSDDKEQGQAKQKTKRRKESRWTQSLLEGITLKTPNYKALQEAANNHKNAPFIPEDTTPTLAAKPTDAQTVAMVTLGDSLDAKASKFVMEFRNKLRYVASKGAWLYWDNHVWKWDTTGQAQEAAKEFGREFIYPVSGESKDEAKARLAWYHKLTAPKGITDVLTLAKTDPMMAASPEQFDAGITELNTPAGIVSLRTGQVTPPAPEKLVKRSTSVAPDANCPTPMYENLLAEAFMGRPELSAYFDDMMGVTLLKGQQEQVFLYMFGKAGSGKGTLMNIAKDILGTGESGYAAYIDSDFFVASRMKQHPTELMQFLGARMVISSEITQGQKMDTGKLKKTTGGDAITGRYMGKDYVTFDPTHTLWLMANDRLQVPHDDQGVWRRLRVIPFDFAKKESEQVGGLFERIMAEEAPGILARWIDKASQYLQEGISTPSVVLNARDEYITEQDTVKEWLEANCEIALEEPQSLTTGAKAARESYLDWCKMERRTSVSPQKFSQALRDHGFNYTTNRVTHAGKKTPVRIYEGFSVLGGVTLLR